MDPMNDAACHEAARKHVWAIAQHRMGPDASTERAVEEARQRHQAAFDRCTKGAAISPANERARITLEESERLLDEAIAAAGEPRR